jgi:hypothetical protein
MPSYYQDLNGTTRTDFSYTLKEGIYRRPIPPSHPFRKKAKPLARQGNLLCPGCGCFRSMTNKCECNS